MELTFTEKKEIILNALIERKGIQYLTDVSAQVMNNPLFLLDVSGKVLSASRGEGSVAVWDIILPGGRLDADYLKQAMASGFYGQMLETDTPMIRQPQFSPYRFLSCRIRDRGNALGLAILVEVNPFLESDAELIVILCKALLFEILYRERTEMQAVPYYGIFRDIIEETADPQEILGRCRGLHLRFPESMVLIGIKRMDSHWNRLSAFFARNALFNELPASYCIAYDEGLLLLMDQSKVTASLIDAILAALASSDVRVGISRPFSDILELKSAFQEIKAIQSVCRKLGMEDPVVWYQGILLYHFMEIVSQGHDLESFCRQEIQRIESYDQVNHTKMKASLEAYLESGRNIQRAANQLGIHKNTLHYRLDRIQALFGIDLSNENTCFDLQFSLRMFRMISSLVKRP